MILWLTCTHGRYRCLQRNLRCYMDQTYAEPSVMFICNSGKPLKLPEDFQLPEHQHVYIDNCGHLGFTSVGEKYNHALKMALELFPDISIVTSADDDDIFLPEHLDAGSKGMFYAALKDRRAYKPQKSYYRYRDDQGDQQITLAENNLEPSIFVRRSWIEQKGYASVSICYHQQWLDPLIAEEKIYITAGGKPTLIYNWGDNGGQDSWDIYKMSGAGEDTQRNFNAHLQASQDMGDGILTPADDNTQYYELVNQCKN